MSKRVHLRQGAVPDIEEIIDYYLGQAGADVAGRFTDALEHAVQHLGDHPLSGSLRFAYELGLPPGTHRGATPNRAPAVHPRSSL